MVGLDFPDEAIAALAARDIVDLRAAGKLQRACVAFASGCFGAETMFSAVPSGLSTHLWDVLYSTVHSPDQKQGGTDAEQQTRHIRRSLRRCILLLET